MLLDPNSADMAIIGCGPAGLSAAVNAKIRKIDTIIFGMELCSPKLYAAPQVDNYLGFPGVTGKELRQKFLDHVNEMKIEIITKKVNTVFKMDDKFILQAGTEEYNARCVIIATGVSNKNLLPGEEELLGKGVGYCATCDGQLYRNKKVAVLSYVKDGEEEAEYLAKLCREVIYIPIYKDFNHSFAGLDNIKIMENNVPLEITGKGKVESLKLKDQEIILDGIFIFRASLPPERLVPGVEIDNNAIKVNKFQETNISGLYAAGDCAGPPYQLAKATGEGQVAALSAVKYLNDLKHKNHSQ
ncbi:MAG TPA: FAD-dependent oxidoreductase [Firmicutes bacterium]|nr:FAD-dependent oxidoreductase [Bacillota bacterium]